MASRFEDILSDCTERLLRGESVEQCLQRYPEQAAELKPLLKVALAATKTACVVEPRPEFKARVRHAVQSRLRSEGRKAEPKRLPALHWIPRWAAVVACVALVFVFVGGGTVAASSNTVPGDTLYSVKTTTEQIQLKLTFSKAAKARLQARFAERRIREIARLAGSGRTARLGAIALRFEAHLAEIQQLAARIEAADPEDGQRVSRLKDTLYANMARDLALLDKAEAKAPWRARGSIAVAKFRLMQKYEKAIAALDELQNRQRGQAGSLGNPEAGSQSGATSGSGAGGELRYGEAAGSGQQGQLTDTELQVQARYAGSR